MMTIKYKPVPKSDHLKSTLYLWTRALNKRMINTDDRLTRRVIGIVAFLKSKEPSSWKADILNFTFRIPPYLAPLLKMPSVSERP